MTGRAPYTNHAYSRLLSVKCFLLLFTSTSFIFCGCTDNSTRPESKKAPLHSLSAPSNVQPAPILEIAPLNEKKDSKHLDATPIKKVSFNPDDLIGEYVMDIDIQESRYGPFVLSKIKCAVKRDKWGYIIESVASNEILIRIDALKENSMELRKTSVAVHRPGSASRFANFKMSLVRRQEAPIQYVGHSNGNVKSYDSIAEKRPRAGGKAKITLSLKRI